MKFTRHPWHWFYSTPTWRFRRTYQLKQQPLCEQCLRDGLIKQAGVVHHVKPHKGNWHLFATSPLESLCKECHDRHTASVERAGLPVKQRTGLDGWNV